MHENILKLFKLINIFCTYLIRFNRILSVLWYSVVKRHTIDVCLCNCRNIIWNWVYRMLQLNARHISTRTNRHQDISALRQIGTWTNRHRTLDKSAPSLTNRHFGKILIYFHVYSTYKIVIYLLMRTDQFVCPL
jgi:hypothetical protein